MFDNITLLDLPFILYCILCIVYVIAVNKYSKSENATNEILNILIFVGIILMVGVPIVYYLLASGGLKLFE